MQQKTPVTVLSWFLWAGKTTLLNHLLTQKGDLKIGLIVNDMSEINIDAKLIKNEIHLARSEEKLVELTNGCICCTLREDLLKEVEKLCNENKLDAIIIESTWISEPLPVAQTFSYIDEETGIDLTKIARLDTMVTVVDAGGFLELFDSGEQLNESSLGVDETDERTISDLLTDQIEFANIIIVNKVDTVEPGQLSVLLGTIKGLNPKARIIQTSHSKVNLKDVVNTGLFDMQEASQSAWWIQELQRWPEHHTPETIEYGINSFVYRADKPFHPQRLHDFLSQKHEGVIRAKGIVWLANRPDMWYELALAGGTVRVSPYGRRLHTMTQAEMEEQELFEEYKTLYADRPHGDMMTEFVVIGVHLDPQPLIQSLDQALVTDAERADETSLWELADPFTW